MSDRRVRVRLGRRSYTVAIGSGMLDTVGERYAATLGRGGSRAMIVSNNTVWTLYGNRLQESLQRAGLSTSEHLIGDGERYKTLTEAERALGTAIGAGLERGQPVVALGGGVVGDLAGLVAALYMRGTPFIQVPTTLLAQIDSSVGGKVAVNHALGKNLIGAFHQPTGVFSDPETLRTLPARELRAGLYEAVKYGVLADRKLFEWIERNLDSLLTLDVAALGRLIEWCCRIKARIVERDEQESGVRRFLNLGHTAGHALESATRYRRFVHGEAVGYGIEVAAELSQLLGLLDPPEVRRIRALVDRIGPRPRVSDLGHDALMEAMSHDKKRIEGKIGFVLPLAIGAVEFRQSVPEIEILRALRIVLERG